MLERPKAASIDQFTDLQFASIKTSLPLNCRSSFAGILPMVPEHSQTGPRRWKPLLHSPASGE
jgi:hypothetical protein